MKTIISANLMTRLAHLSAEKRTILELKLKEKGQAINNKMGQPGLPSANRQLAKTRTMARTTEDNLLATIWGMETEPPTTSRQAPATETIVEPDNEIEERLVMIIKELLMRDQVSTMSNFFDLGATSLDMVQLHHRLKEEFNANVSIVDIFRYVTIQSLALRLRTEEVNLALRVSKRNQQLSTDDYEEGEL